MQDCKIVFFGKFISHAAYFDAFNKKYLGLSGKTYFCIFRITSVIID